MCPGALIGLALVWGLARGAVLLLIFAAADLVRSSEHSTNWVCSNILLKL
jgi:hypothetical protein